MAAFYTSLDFTKLPRTELKAEPWDPTWNPFPGSSGAHTLHLTMQICILHFLLHPSLEILDYSKRGRAHSSVLTGEVQPHIWKHQFISAKMKCPISNYSDSQLLLCDRTVL